MVSKYIIKEKFLKTYHQKVLETEPWFCYFCLANGRLISRRVRAAAPGTNQCSSLAAGRDAGAAALHTIPARLSVRPGVRSGFSLASRRTTEQPSCARSPLLGSSLPPSLPPSLPRSRLSPHLPRLPAPPRPPSVSAYKWVGTNNPPIGRRGLHLLTAPCL